MPNKAKHAFGSSSAILSALQDGKINARDVLFLDENTANPKVGWIDKSGNPVVIDTQKVVVVDEESLPEIGEVGKIYIFGEDGYFWNGKDFINLCKPTDVTELKSSIEALESVIVKNAEDAKSYTDEKFAEALEIAENLYEHVKYEISHKPEGTIVSYRDREIRVMCPVDTVWTKQNVGATGNANMHYMGFKAYAPKGAVSFKEGDRGVIIDEMFTFDDDFAGTDEYGRNYSICWFALASCKDDVWTYYGANSSKEKYIGWDYIVEWYDANGVMIASDSVRINLSNEECHFANEPYYVGSIKKEFDTKIEEKIAEVESAYEVIEF